MNGAPPPRPMPSALTPRSATNGNAEPTPQHRRGFADALARHSGKGLQKDKEDSPFAAIAMPREFAPHQVIEARTVAGDVDADFQAHLDRIAAAIAEMAKSGADAEVQLSLPLGGYRVEGAVLGRDLAGQINVLLVPSHAVPPALATQWSEQLNERLLRREIRVGRIGVQAPKRSTPAA